MVPFVVGAPVERIVELTGETLKPPLRVEGGYEVWCNGKLRVVHIEMEKNLSQSKRWAMVKSWFRTITL